MPQQTNLNVSPYFDDFDASNDYHRVLFKPGYPVQARELTTLQSILQNQIEKFGQHFFKEGTKVIPGNTSYNTNYYCIQLENNFQGIPVSAYVDQLIGNKITGKTSGISATVDKILLSEESERDNLTLYINYLTTSTTNNTSTEFFDGEELVCNTNINSTLLGNSVITAGSSFAVTIATDAASAGSAFTVQKGVYFAHGSFVNVETETLILDQYGTNPSYKVGLFVSEQVINSDLDESLNDNSQGFNNYAAPGADRLKITASLFKKPLDDSDDDAFVELVTVNNGALKSQTVDTDYHNNFIDLLARRTFAESGDYYVTPFDTSVADSLNNNIGNRGIYQPGQFTEGGSTPSDSLSLYKISPGRAFVRGYEVETISPTFVDSPKPRSTKTIKDQSVVYNTGPTLKINKIHGAPSIGIGNTYIVSLRDSRVGIDQKTAPGNEIGIARIYDFRLESGSYNTSNGNLNEWDISLYDVQSITELTVNQEVTLPIPTYVKGKNSGATAYLNTAASNTKLLKLYETNGNFIPNESLIFNGVPNGRVAIAITEHGIDEVKSIFGTDDGVVGTGATFNADVIQSTSFNIGIATVSIRTGNQSTVRSENPVFISKVKTNNLVQYTDLTTSNDPIVAKVISVGTDNITIAGVATVTSIVNGKLPGSTLNVTDFKILGTVLEKSSDNTLYTPLSKRHIATVDLTSATINIRKVFTVNIANNQLSTPVSAGENEKFLPFDEERYSLIRSDGSVEPLSSDKVALLTAGTQLQVYGLGTNDGSATLVTTLSKVKPKAKEKLKNRVNSAIIINSNDSASGIGSTTLNDGLVYGNYPFGTRVQDEVISLNTPDIIEIQGIFESSNNNNASAPKVILSSITSSSTTTEELIIGEPIIGQSSGANAIVAEKLTDSQISIIYKNDILFVEGETVFFDESNSTAVATTLDSPSFEISSDFKFSTGQDSTYYDYGSIIRKKNIGSPSRRLKVYFTSLYFDSSDDGDITTVESYQSCDYSRDIQSIDGHSNSDIIDIRPRVSNYSVAENARSPFEFYGRTFTASGNSSANILASDESLLTTFSHYLGRIDRVFVTKNGTFQVKYGDPAELPDRPNPIDDALEIATITLPPYLYSPSDATVRFLDHKRFRMKDIKNLENRINNLEYYTALSMLETNTVNMFIPDSDGLNRFKSGFFVDNFTSFNPQETSLEINNSIHPAQKVLRPRHYTNSVNLITGPVVNTDSAADLNFNAIEGTNVRKTNDIITLDYSEVAWLTQAFGTRSESVTPFILNFWTGSLDLTPASDVWVDTTRIEARIIDVEGNFEVEFRDAVRTQNIDPQTGFAPIVWNAWQTNWTGTTFRDSTRTRSIGSGGGWGWNWSQTIRDDLRETIETGTDTRSGSQTVITEQFDRTSVGDRVVQRDLVPFMRSRNIQFVSRKLRPYSRVYAYFDGIDVSRYCVPKLLQINMTSGTFQVGETVVGVVQQTGLSQNTASTTSPNISFRVAVSNHRLGPYNIPDATYPENPYNPPQLIPDTYSSTSTILNVDTFSLSNQVQGLYSGWVQTGMVLTGQSSGAQATITDLLLIPDITSTLIGSYFIPDPSNINFPRFDSGTKVLQFINDSENNQDNATSVARSSFESSGTINTIQENIVSVRNARIEQRAQTESRAASRSLGTAVVGSTVLSSSRWFNSPPPPPPPPRWWGRDPLAQSFQVTEDTGIFVTSCDIFFNSKDTNDTPVTIQIRTMDNGIPTQRIIPLSEVDLDPVDITVSSDGSIATRFEFKAPVYLEGGIEYAICLLSNSPDYSVFISQVGENDLLTQTFVANQPYLGSLFKSQNASTWSPSQWEDLKFTLYRADFLESGSAEFYSPELNTGNKQIASLLPDSISIVSKEIRVGLGSTVHDTGLTLGNTVTQEGTLATGDLVGTAGSITVAQLNVINTGIGYSPISGQLSFNNVNLVTITGNGRGATANLTVQNGSIISTAATVVGGGTGYRVGDVVGVSTLGSSAFGGLGRNLRMSVVSIYSTSEIILNNVQGNFIVGSGNTLFYNNNVGVKTELNYSDGGDVQISSIETVTDGLHLKVNHQNHGMYFGDNMVKISGVYSDIKPTKLSTEYSDTSVAAISVDDASQFGTFENVGVGTTNTGFLLIGNEVVEYTSVSGNLIGGSITRGSNPVNYPVGTPVYKYELGGINLRRINGIHTLSQATVSEPITFDSYHIKLDTSTKFNVNNADRSVDVGFPSLYFNKTKSSGGYQIEASQNMPFEIMNPIVQNLTVRGTSISAEVRTTTSQSISGNEIPYVNAGFESITINEDNYFDSPRMIASKVNENEKLTSLPGNKSMNMRLLLQSLDSRVSPVIDSQRVSAILVSNRVDNIITDFTTDSRVNQLDTDPTGCQYISKEITLENSATSVKILLSAHVNVNSDIRAFYAINSGPGFEPIFVPFPGYANLNNRGQIISLDKSDGQSDSFVPKSNQYGFDAQDLDYRDYTFTADGLPTFRSYRIKIIMTSNTQVHVPKVKDLRVLSLA